MELKEATRLRQAIADTPERFEELVNNTDLCVCVTDRDGTFTYINDNYKKMYGYEENQVVGKHCIMVVPPADREKLLVAHDKFILEHEEIPARWTVLANNGRLMTVVAEAMYSEEILNGRPSKITFVHVENQNAGQLTPDELAKVRA
ncbi:MAG: PAS domain-containing protein [Bacteroidota bacterium]